MNLKSWTRSLIYIVLILILAFVGDSFLDSIRETAKLTFEFNTHIFTLVSIISFSGIGFVLGLEHLISERKKEGKWSVNLPKLLILGLPSLYFSLGIYLYFINIDFVYNVLTRPIMLLIDHNDNYISVFQLLLGYIITTSFYKKI